MIGYPPCAWCGDHVGMIERFGKYRRTLPPGLHIVVPLLDRMPVVVDMRETVQPFAHSR